MSKVESKETIQELKERWDSFKTAWLSVRDILAEMVGCPDQQRNRAFESYILLLEDSTPIGYLLSHYQSLDTYDEIIKVILELLKIQGTLLDERKSLAETKTISHLFDPEGAPIPLESLPFDSDNQYLLVTGDESDHEFEHFALSQVSLDNKFTRENISFNWNRIERFVYFHCFIVLIFVYRL